MKNQLKYLSIIHVKVINIQSKKASGCKTPLWSMWGPAVISLLWELLSRLPKDATRTQENRKETGRWRFLLAMTQTSSTEALPTNMLTERIQLICQIKPNNNATKVPLPTLCVCALRASAFTSSQMLLCRFLRMFLGLHVQNTQQLSKCEKSVSWSH